MAFQNGWRGPDIVSDGLVLYLDAGSPNSYRPDFGNTWKDISGNNNNGTLTNGPTYSSIGGGSIVFDGTNDTVICADSTTTNITGSSITLEGWVNPSNASSYKQIFARASGINSNQRQYGLYVVGGASAQLGFETRTNIGNVDTAYGLITANTWQHAAGVYNGSNMIWYVNGVQVGLVAQTGNLTTQVSSVYIGQFSSAGFSTFNGNISSTKIYNRALSVTEILQNYNAQKSRFGL
jgi:hypothetical protein